MTISNLSEDVLRAVILLGLCEVLTFGQTSAGALQSQSFFKTVPGYVRAPPLILGQKIIDISSGGIEARSTGGQVLWREPVTDYLPTTLVALDDAVIVVESEAYALGISDGSRKWTRELDGNGALSQPVAYQGGIYFGTQRNLIYCLDGRTGVVEWTKDISEGSTYPGVVRAVTVSSGSLVVATEKWADEKGTSVAGDLYRLSLQGGDVIWKYDARLEDPSAARSGMSSTPVVANGIVYVSDALGGSVRAISFDTGKLVWKADVKIGAGVLAPPLVFGKEVVFGGGDGVVRVVDAPSGNAITSRDLGSAIVDLQACGSGLVATTWGMAVKLGAQTLDMRRINDRLTMAITSKLAHAPGQTSLIGFNGANLVTINCDE
jgi:outer membrane protein assembly factor BamB